MRWHMTLPTITAEVFTQITTDNKALAPDDFCHQIYHLGIIKEHVPADTPTNAAAADA